VSDDLFDPGAPVTPPERSPWVRVGLGMLIGWGGSLVVLFGIPLAALVASVEDDAAVHALVEELVPMLCCVGSFAPIVAALGAYYVATGKRSHAMTTFGIASVLILLPAVIAVRSAVTMPPPLPEHVRRNLVFDYEAEVLFVEHPDLQIHLTLPSYLQRDATLEEQMMSQASARERIAQQIWVFSDTVDSGVSVSVRRLHDASELDAMVQQVKSSFAGAGFDLQEVADEGGVHRFVARQGRVESHVRAFVSERFGPIGVVVRTTSPPLADDEAAAVASSISFEGRTLE